MKRELNYVVMDTIRIFFDRKNDYLVLKVKGTIFSCKKEDFEEYVINCTDEHWSKVNEWIDKYLIPFMNRKTINYYTFDSRALKVIAEWQTGEHIADELLIYLLASRGVSGNNKLVSLTYPLILYYPLSSRFKVLNYDKEAVI